MKKILSLLTIMLCLVTFSSCNSDSPDTEPQAVEVSVASSLVSSPAGYTPGLYMEVTFVASNQVRYILPTDIVGFNYEEGYTYRLMIKEMRHSSSSEVYYLLERVISKTADASPDVPLKPIQ